MAPAKKIRLAGLGDLHAAEGRRYGDLFREMNDAADVLALTGDLTASGLIEEAKVLADDLRHLKIPVVGVLGNHDHDAGFQNEIEHILIEAGMQLLGGRTREIGGISIAGVKGFGGGFGKYMLASFGEEAMKHFAGESIQEAVRLENALRSLADRERVVVILHYAPIASTLGDEPREVFPYLGSSRYEETIDRFDNIKAVLHGHAHHGAYRGKTGGGIPVYNCAMSIQKESGRPYALIEV